MNGLNVQLLLILSAIAVVCAVVLWRYRSSARTHRRASREQARQGGSARTYVASDSRAVGAIVHAPRDPAQPEAVARVGPALQRTLASAALVPAAASAAAELQRDAPWLDTVPSEHTEPVGPAAALSEQLTSSPVAKERIDADENVATVLLAENARDANRDGGRTELAASAGYVAPSLIDELPMFESATGSVHLPGPATLVVAAAPAALTAQSIEAVLRKAEPGRPLTGSNAQQPAPPMPAPDWAAADRGANVPFAAERESSAALHPLPAADSEQEPTADPAEPLPGVDARGYELTPPHIEYDRPPPGQKAGSGEPLHSEEKLAAVAVEQVLPVTRVHEPAATATTAAETFFEEAAAAPQAASMETAPPFARSLVPTSLGFQPPEPVRSAAATQSEAELDVRAPSALPIGIARDGAQDLVVATHMAAAVQTLPPKPEAAVPSAQLAGGQADEATPLDQQTEGANGNANDDQPSEDDAAQLLQPAQHADEATGGESGAGSDLDELDALRDALSRPARQAVHRDRRGRQPSLPQPGAERKRAKRQSNALRPPAEARLRLMLHPIRRTVGMALILLRPTEFPEQVTLELNGAQTVHPLEEGQYGDVDLTWDMNLLLNEIRVSCTEGYQWVRGARPVHIFAADPAQADMVSVSAATAGTEHTIVCRDQDVGTVCDIAESAGSPRPQPLRRFSGVPDGWVVLSGYHPTRAAALQPAQAFSPLDPGHSLEITLQGGLEVGRRLYAQGKPPRIRIEPALDGIAVRIGGATAADSGDGAWEAPGWDTPGQHRVEVFPGPSLTYEIQVDPAMQGGWAFWDAHSGRTADDEGPWSRAQICGAQLSGPSGERVIAAELQPSILALGIDGTVGALRPRGEAGVSVGFAAGMPAFLLMSSGRRRRQGKIVWLGLPQFSEVVARPRRLSEIWIEAVRSAAARRLAMQADEEGAGQSIWHKAVLLARSAKRQRHG